MRHMDPVVIEVVMNLPVHLGQCSHCRLIFEDTDVERLVNKEVQREYPSDLNDDFIRLSGWIRELSHLYRHRIAIKFIDIKSFMGLYKSIVHGLRTYPAFIVNKKDVVRGWDWEKLEKTIDRYIHIARMGSYEMPSHP